MVLGQAVGQDTTSLSLATEAPLSSGIILQSDPPDALKWLAEHLQDRRPHELADVLAEGRLVGLEAETVYRAVYRLKDCVIGAWPGGVSYLQMHLPPGK